MFGKSSRETQKPENVELPDVQFSPNLTVDANQPPNLPFPQSSPMNSEPETSELVTTVEKISRIVSPYFIVVVGLSLYENNFLIGTILILVGILTLLKVSPRDVTKAFQWVKEFLGLGSS